MAKESASSRELLRRYRDGDSEAAAAIFDRYLARLIALARSRIGSELQRRIDADDVVQSTYRSFFVHARADRYELARTGDLWRLLAAMTLNKLGGQIEKHASAKRNVHCEQAVDSLRGAAAPEPPASEVAVVLEELQGAVANLAPLERQALIGILRRESIEQIARSLGKSQRTARRLAALVRHKIEQRLLANEDREPAIAADAPLRYGDYVLEKLLGAGGMGKVFRAREKASGKIVAIKALHKARQSEARAVARFVQEAQILARLRHDNIVGVQGLGRFPSGGYFLVMDYIEGIDLQTRLREGPLPPGEALRIVKKVALAIAYAHEHGVVHCDLKPANVLLGEDGRVLVADFGFAYLVASSHSGIGVGGTAGYVAPEILFARAAPTPAADVYALGKLLWALTKSDEFPAPLDDIYRRCVAQRPDERYRSLREFIDNLDRFTSAGTPGAASPSERHPRSR
jgi:DNA-directed RNA polymerase specialized sigma24 family protein